MNEPLGYDVRLYDSSSEPLVIIDQFSSTPEKLMEAAADAAYQPLGKHYPGIRAPADPSYLAERAGLLETILKTVFGITSGAQLVECAYSIVTTDRGALTPIQRIPHFDSTDPGRIALLHYMGGPDMGGTAFFRHRQTGFEVITSERMSEYDIALQKEAHALPKEGYASGSSQQFAQIGLVEASYNRMVIYRGYRLHSGHIPLDLPLSADPRTGRLTINTFLQER